MHLPLTALRNGETGVITATYCSSAGQQMYRHKARKRWIKHAMAERCARRLNDLGLTPGTKVTVVKSAPFNGPLEISVRGSLLAIGRGMAGRILVDVKR
ncbi:MAG: ferrous iron transport protein A [Candidatus Bathyarchaeota archaeon]|nr:ferrous iron transport protein A [Candidatus Bathyarchaeum sp.]